MRIRAAFAAALASTCGSVAIVFLAGFAAAQTRPPKPTVAAPPSAASPNPQTLKDRNQELDAVREEQRKAAEAEQKLASEKETLAEDRRKLSQALIETAAGIRANEERAAVAEGRLQEIQGSETGIRRSLDGRRAVIAEVLAALQRISHHPMPPAYAPADDAVESLRAAISLGAVLPEMRSEVDGLLEKLSGLARLKKDSAVEHDRLAGELAQLGEAQKRMTFLNEERQHRLTEVEQALGAERQKVLALGRQADSLKDLIAKLEQRLDGAARTARAAARPSEATRPSPLAALHDPGRLAPAASFAAAKGKLSLPVNGMRIREFGGSDGMGGSEKGLSIATRAGAQVTAPSDGWVMYAAPYRSYGQLLILNVGGGYHVLLAGMERITVDLGQFVLTGEPVGVMGSGTQVASSSGSGLSSWVRREFPV